MKYYNRNFLRPDLIYILNVNLRIVFRTKLLYVFSEVDVMLKCQIVKVASVKEALVVVISIVSHSI